MDKAALRRTALAARGALTEGEVAAKSAAIAEVVRALPLYRNAETVCCYMAFGSEVATRELITAMLAEGKRVVLPRVASKEYPLMDLFVVHNLDDLTPGPFGILEPTHGPVLNGIDIDLFLVPGVAFDTTGNRLGYGKGYYDNLLSATEGWRVALAFAVQIVPHVPTHSGDERMHYLATEAGLIDCAQGQRADDTLRLRNMVFYGYHGAFPQEREQGIRLAVDVELRLDLQLPGHTDDLTTTVNYPAVYKLIQRIQSEREFHLFEALVEQIALGILGAFPTVREVTIAARKFNPPIGGLMDAFEVEITRRRPVWE